MSLEERLEKLQELLGQGVSLIDHPEEDIEQPKGVDQMESKPETDSHAPAHQGDLLIQHPFDLGHQFSRSSQFDGAQDRERAVRHEKAFDRSGFRVGEPLDRSAVFCPVKVMITYPERFIGKANKPLAKPFFSQILKDRVWDFFYLHDPKEPTRDPYLLVPTAQFEVFLDTVNAELGISLSIPKGVNEDKFAIKFGEGGTPRPRYLRRSEDETALEIRPWPKIDAGDVSRFNSATAEKKDSWRSKMNLVKTGLIANKGNNEKAARKQRDRQKMLLDTQEYLCLRSSSVDLDVVFICVDVEAIERSPNPISEIGFAILDTRDIRSVAPGPCGENWRTSIKCHHLRVWEYAGLRNFQFVHGCPDLFDFGESTFPRKAHVRREIMSILAPYINDSRNIVMVGHDIYQDIRYLSTLGVNLLTLNSLVGQVDTKDIHQAWRDNTNGRGLSKILSELEIPSKNLHNAGNDAYYTVCVMLGVALEQMREQQAKAQ
ncbi:hypothetical protein QQZ08_005004 [Neonectria magnoliae]|uniref:Gfd2/YDR514C-like C-terminal domain-containing protein n=1 Tax=Neonectria magnoliae TaxID=2732573 RepID=A0ABR1I6X4_9HYPO